MYQLSNFAQSLDLESKHNIMYWEGDEDYYAIGSGAAGLRNGIRMTRPKSLPAYLKWVRQLQDKQ